MGDMQDMQDMQIFTGNFRQLDDPDFLAERARVRGLLEHQPETSAGRAALERVYAALTEEFCHRAGIAWRRAAGQDTTARMALGGTDGLPGAGMAAGGDGAGHATRAPRQRQQRRPRGRKQAMSDTPGRVTPHSRAARLLATEVLLADPEALADDVLESCLYLLRDRLQGADGEDTESENTNRR